jgi:PAS domain-containing protein
VSMEHLYWWSNLRHGGLLLDLRRLSSLIPAAPPQLYEYHQDKLRREISFFLNDPREHRTKLITHVLESVCGFGGPGGAWHRGGNVAATWTRRGLAGEAMRPNHLWLGHHGATLPIFIDDEKRLGIGRSKRTISHALQWLRQGSEQLAVVTNGQQWRLLFAGLDYDAFAEWELDQWLAEGRTTAEFDGLRALLSPALWTPPGENDEPSPLLRAVNDSRKGQSDLSQILGERVRQATELLIQGHADVFNAQRDGLDSQDIYRAGVRLIMRMVVVFFAESREGLLPRDNPIYHGSYSLQGLRTELERTSPRRLAASFAAFPRILALFRLIHRGCSHEAMPVPSYGGELFAPGDAANEDGMKRALHLLETACFERQLMNDNQVRLILDLLTRTQIKIRQGRTATRVSTPVDFSSLDSEYIGILYEGLLDFELRSAPADQPVVFLAVGNQPALPLATLEAMDDAAIKNLLEKLEDTSADDEEEDAGDAEEAADEPDDAAEAEEVEEELEEQTARAEGAQPEMPAADARFTAQGRAEQWAQRACAVANLVKKPRGKLTPEKRMQHDRKLAFAARQLVTKVVLPGEWYLVRWGGTRKGSGTFYTRPQLAIPTVHRTLRPLAYDPPLGEDGQPNLDAPAEQWKPKKPEEILALKACDPACGSGSFCLAALRFLTDALYRALIVHKRIRDHAGRAVLDLIFGRGGQELLVNEPLPCRPEDDEFEPRTRAVLRRYVVERCIYGVDLDPLAVELCRLSLWIETLDRNLPLTFLDHKIKPGNSLVGAWFDQFLHYPAMAWEREGGDKSHINGVHFAKEAWTKAIGAKKKEVKQELIDFLAKQKLLFRIDLTDVRSGHAAAEEALREIHALGIHQAAERAEKYAALRQDPAFVRLKEAFDLWCAIWFWSPERLDQVPLPGDFYGGELPEAIPEAARRVAAERRFFHWELEFPDVFNAESQGFDAVLGNPPWDISKPSSKEFFSAIDPLYRGYGKQEAIGRQKTLFESDTDIERRWLEYSAFFRAMSNWVKFAGFPFGHRVRWKEDEETGEKTPKHDFNLGDRGQRSFESSEARHRKWKQQREESSGYADADHAFRYQGSGDINSYKMFLEQAHSLLRDDGRLGLVVPSGLYSDYGTGGLRELFLEHCRWEWLFGFENREAIFDIHRSFKFNPIIVRKGGMTTAIRTAFMRRQLADWERGEELFTLYPRERVLQFSPRSRALLEIQSQRDLEVLTKIYANSVLLGDQSPEGWGIKYATEFHMTNDSRLFPPRPNWEEWGYRPDEYSRWIKGKWKPIAELWAELGIDASQPAPLDATCAANIETGIENGEAGKSDWRVRCAQPPYDTLPIPRADIPPGIILSREADAWVSEDEIPVVTFMEANGKPLRVKIENEDGEKEEVEVTGPAVAQPLYEGRMIGQFDFSEKGWVSGKGRSAEWRDIDWAHQQIEPQFLMACSTWSIVSRRRNTWPSRLAFMDVTSATNSRTMIAAVITGCPAGNKVPVLTPRANSDGRAAAFLCGVMNSFAYDFSLRRRLGGTTLNWFICEETAVPSARLMDSAKLPTKVSSKLTCPAVAFSPNWLTNARRGDNADVLRCSWSITSTHRLASRATLDAASAALLRLTDDEFRHVLGGCDLPRSAIGDGRHEPKGFWRIDKDKHPEHRLTVLSFAAFHDLREKIAACNGDVATGIEVFCEQNDGEGWMLPETLRLSDYGLGHDDRAKEHQPVRSFFGPRFYDWQLAQTAEESWRECHLHARNLLGEASYQALLRGIERGDGGDDTPEDAGASAKNGEKADKSASNHAQKAKTGKGPTSTAGPSGYLFDVEDRPLFQSDDEVAR